MAELSEHCGNLRESFDAMTSYIRELTSIPEAHHQQVKGAWPPLMDKACHPSRPAGQYTSRSVEENMHRYFARKGLMRYC